MVWLKALHLATLSIWCAGLFYLPGLFMLHPRAHDRAAFHRLRIVSRYTFIIVVSPAAVLAIISGTALVWVRGAGGDWLAVKLVIVTLMVLFHLYCGNLLRRLRKRKDRDLRHPALHLALALVPAVLVPLVLWLALAKPQWLPVA